jgi:hypothetical protein
MMEWRSTACCLYAACGTSKKKLKPRQLNIKRAKSAGFGPSDRAAAGQSPVEQRRCPQLVIDCALSWRLRSA